MTSLILCALLALPAPRGPKQGPPSAQAAPVDPARPDLSDAELRDQVQAYLGTIDTPISAARWKALGPRAEPILHALAADRNNLPTKRAKAIDGLAQVASNRTALLREGLAESEDETLAVRYSALRGLGVVLPAKKLFAQLKPMLESAKDGNVRAAAGEVLARHSPAAGCAAVKAQAAREDENGRARFGRALDHCFPGK